MMFFAQSNVVEKGVRVRDLPYQRIDAVTGAVVGWKVSFQSGCAKNAATM